MKKQTKKPNSFWLKNKHILCTALTTMSFLLGLNHGVVAQNNASYNANSVPIGGTGSSAFGWGALKSNTGDWNAACGNFSLHKNTTGNWNTAIGYKSLYLNTTGKYNTASGFEALHSNDTGSWNTAIGFRALYTNTIGKENSAFGLQSLHSNNTGNYNTANGVNALYFNTKGNNNAASGHSALYSNTTGSYNTALGYYADVNKNNLTYATAIGAYAKVSESNTIQLGNDSVTKVYAGVGTKARLIAGGIQITGGAPAVGKVLTSDADGVGSWQILPTTGWGLAGNAGTVDSINFIGTTDNIPFNIRVNKQKAGRIDENNAFYGYQSGSNFTTGSNNTSIGSKSLYTNTSGGNNTANGRAALYSNTTGQGNTASGESALYNSTIGSFNTASGVNALVNNITGNNNTALGFAANVSKDSLTNATAIGYGAIVDSSNKIRLGNAMVEKVETQFKYTTVSDGRFKNKISQEDIKGLAFIKKLRPVAYNFDTRKFQEHITQNMPSLLRKQYMNQDFSASTAVRRSGFIAQEVEKAAEEVGYDFDGVSKPQDASGNYSLAYSQFVVPLVKGMQEQQQIIEQLQKEKEQQKEINNQLQQQLQQQQQRLEALEKRIVSNNHAILTKDELANRNTDNQVQVYPNPNGGMFNVVVPAGSQRMELIDMKGTLIKTINVDSKTSSHQLNLSGYAKGVYILDVWINGKTQTSKIIVQ